MKKRRLLSLILTICMVLSLTPMVAYAEDDQIPAKSFVVGFDPCGVDEETEGKVQVQIGDGEPWFAGAWDEYGYEDGNTPITFTLTPPAEGVGYTPVVIVLDASLYGFVPVLQQNEGKYSFAITPNAIAGNDDLDFVVYVYWCWEFDTFAPDEGQFMVETHVRGGDANGTILIQPGAEVHKSFGSKDRYIYNRDDDEDNLYVTFIPQPGMKLVAFQIGDEVYGDEAIEGFPEEEMHPLPELRADGQCTMTIPVPALSDTDADEAIYVEAIFEGAYPVAPPAGLTWDGKIAKWDAVEGADHYRVTLMRGFANSNGEISWAAMANSGIITDTCEFDFSNRISSSDDSAKYCFRVCAIKNKVCSDEVESSPYNSITDNTVDNSVDASSISVELFVTFRDGETGETASPVRIDTVTPENVTVGTFETVKTNAIEEAKTMLNAWLETTREENPDKLFTVVGDMTVEGDKESFDNRTFTMRNPEPGSGTTSPYMEITGDYGYTGSYSVTLTVEARNITDAHTHNLTLVPAKDSTCTEAGNKAYYTCDGCDKWFEDATGAVEISDHSSVVLPVKDHTASDWKSDADNHWKECNVVGCGVIIEGSKAAHSYGDDNVCDICGYSKPASQPSYSIIEGANSSWTKNTDETLTFRANGDFSKFTGVKVDDTLIDAKNYTAVSGSTIVTFKADYLNTLSVGTHKLTVVYNDGVCSTNFEVKAATEPAKPTEPTKTTDTSKPADSQSPQTGDNNNLALWFALLFVSGAGTFGTVVYSKRKKRAE